MKFTCDVCRGEFPCDDSAESERERERELQVNFPGVTKEECLKVCDACYKVMMSTYMVPNGKYTCH